MPIDIENWRKKQKQIADQVILDNRLPPLDQLKTVGGADISCNRFSKIGFAAVLVFSYPDLELIDTATAINELEFPYIPGYLAFREWPLIETCLTKLSTLPDALICDGQGIAHPRQAGLACHVGVESGLVTVGCAKTKLVGDFCEPKTQRGAISDLMLDDKKIGEVLRTKNNVKPLFISPGHQIDFLNSTHLILDLCRKYRLPETIRTAHHKVNQLRRRHYE